MCKKNCFGRYMAVLCAAMLAAIIIALCLGSTPLTLGQVLQAGNGLQKLLLAAT